MNRSLWYVGAALAAMVPGVAVRAGAAHLEAPAQAVVYGLAIVGAAFLLSWAAEVAQMDISQGFALALLALIAVLPEYVVDASFAWLAAEDPQYAHYAVANMTGANRLLIGIAWPMVVFIGFFRYRQRVIELGRENMMVIVVLFLATIYAFTLPFKGRLSLVDFAVLFAIFAYYIYRVARMPAEEPHLAGPAALVGSLRPWQRRSATVVLAAIPAAIVLFVAEPFARSLVDTGVALGINEFLLVQWVAPLASEAPEFVVVALFAWRGYATNALGTLVSSKINQWTLLVGMLPLVYAIALGAPEALPLDTRQEHEILLTAAQSFFAIALLIDRRLTWRGAGALLGLFLVQFFFPDTRLAITVVYLVLGVGVLFMERGSLLSALGNLRRPTLSRPEE